ncbi:MAG: DNA primase [Bacteroidetes bacterium]|nr:DNA primase [Bacteroidota bacterium]
MISRATIDRIYQAILIEDVIGEFVHLKRSGSSFRGLSPFVNEKTPSFFVVPAKGIYKDFSSGKGGNAIDFLMQHEKLSYPEALRWLAARYNIEIEEEQESEEQRAEKSEREQLAVVTEFANKYFQEQLHNSEIGRNIGLSYFEERGFREDIIKKFQLGYCPEGWDKMSQAALSAGHSLTYLLKTGLTREKDGAPYDFFRGRVMFPIHNVSGKVIAFGGRTLKVEKEIAKYFNSPESDLYHKSSVLYGMHLAKNAMVKDDNCYLVEGYTDVIALHQAGVENVVASSGTSLTEGQIRLIKRFTSNITILYDGDKAGIKASFRGIDMILKEGLNVRVATFPDGDDPDSFAKKHSSEEITNYIATNAKDFIRYKTSLLLEEVGNDPIKKAGLIKGIVESIGLIPDAIKRSVFIQDCAQIMQIGESVLLLELNKILLSNKKGKEEISTTPTSSDVQQEFPIEPTSLDDGFTTLPIERELIRLLITYGEYGVSINILQEDMTVKAQDISVADYIIGTVEEDKIKFQSELYQLMFNEYVSLVNEKSLFEESEFTQHGNERVRNEAADIFTPKYQLSENWMNKHGVYSEKEEDRLAITIKDCLFRLKLRNVQLRMKSLEMELAEAKSDEEIFMLMAEKKRLDFVRAKIADYFGIIAL